MRGELLAAFLFWSGVVEAQAGLRQIHGLALMGSRRWLALQLAVPALAFRSLLHRPLRGLLALVLMLVPALAAHLGLGTLRSWWLDPRRALLPGQANDRSVERLDLPMSEGALPALYVRPINGARAAVCVVHGSGGHKSSYAWRLVNTLLAHNLAVLLIDMDGHGDNPRPQRFPHILENVSTALSWLRERYPRVGLLGMSLGGAVSTRAVADGQRPDALLLFEVPPQLELTPAIYRRETLYLFHPASWSLLADTGLRGLVAAWREAKPIRAEIGTVDLFTQLDLLKSISGVSCPLLLVYGAADAIVTPQQAQAIQRAAPPETPLWIIPYASHLTLPVHQPMLNRAVAWMAGQLLESAR